MAKIRVGQLAKQLNLKTGEVLERLRALGVEVKTNLSTVEEDIAARLKAAAPIQEKQLPEAPKMPTQGRSGAPSTTSMPVSRPPAASQAAGAPSSLPKISS